MSVNATAEALATEAATPDVASDLTEDQEMAAVFDRMSEGDNDTTEPESAPASEEPEAGEPEAVEAEATEEPEEQAEQETKEPVKAPTELPRAVREAWADLPEDVRSGFLESQREMSRKLADSGRMVQGLSPIRESLVRAAQEIPALANMRPQEVADQVFELAKVSAGFKDNPMGAMMTLVRQHGLEGQLRQVLSGQTPDKAATENANLLREVAALKQQLKQVSDPEYLREQVTQVTSQTQMQSKVESFAQQAEHWSSVENVMPKAIELVRETAPDASPQDVLSRAYELAVSQFVPEAKAPPSTAAITAAPSVDPEKTQAAQKAKSVNVTGRSTGKSKPLTEDQELERAWNRLQE